MTRKGDRERNNIYLALTVPHTLNMCSLLNGLCDIQTKVSNNSILVVGKKMSISK